MSQKLDYLTTHGTFAAKERIGIDEWHPAVGDERRLSLRNMCVREERDGTTESVEGIMYN